MHHPVRSSSRHLIAVAAMLTVAGTLTACARVARVPHANDPRWKALTSAPGAARLDLTGAPDKPGPFVYLLKVPAGLRVDAHAHNADLTARVRKGHQIISMQRSNAIPEVHELRPGQRYTIAAGQLHMEQFPEETVVELRGTGPLRSERPPSP